MSSALSQQEGGNHYKDMPIQPIEFCHVNKLGPCETMAIKYLSRWRKKGGLQDLRKAIHMIQVLIELETPKVEIKDGPYCYYCEQLADFSFGSFCVCSNCAAEKDVSTTNMNCLGRL